MLLYWLKFFLLERICQCDCCRNCLLNPNAPFYKENAKRIQFDFIYLIKIIGAVSVFLSKKFSQLSIVNVSFVDAFLKFLDADRHVFAHFEHGALFEDSTAEKKVVFCKRRQAQTGEASVMFCWQCCKAKKQNLRLDRCLRGPCQEIDLILANRRAKQEIDWFVTDNLVGVSEGRAKSLSADSLDRCFKGPCRISPLTILSDRCFRRSCQMIVFRRICT